MAKKRKRNKRPEAEIEIEAPTPEEAAPKISLSRYRENRHKESTLGVLFIAGDPIIVEFKHNPVVDGHPADGFFHAAESTIVLDTDLSLQAQWEVLYHEIVHAIAYKYGLGLSDEDEEKLANIMGKALAQALVPWHPKRGLKPWTWKE